ncbi:alanine:cation symporter family protein [Shigella flexneri]
MVILFCPFSSIVANYIYAENNLFFLRLNDPKAIWCSRSAPSQRSSAAPSIPPLMWQLADIIIACMAVAD